MAAALASDRLRAGRGGLTWLWLSGVVIILDQLSKVLAQSFLAPYEPVPVLPSLNLTLMYNTGAAFSFLSQAGGWQRWLFTILALGISAAIVAWLRVLPPRQAWVGAGLALILGGAIGNVVDRLLLGHVTDFIQVYYRDWYWPAFNLADSSITVGVAILLIDGLFARKHKFPGPGPTSPP